MEHSPSSELTGFQLVKKFPTFYGTRRLITAFTSACNLSLSWASTIQSISPLPTSWRSILILSFHLRLGLPSGLPPSLIPHALPEILGKKVKVTPVQELRLCTGRTAHRGSRGIALPFHDHGTRRGWGVSVTLRPLFIPGKTRYPSYRRLGGPPGPVWTGAENLTPTGIRSPYRPARSQPLYRLSYPAHHQKYAKC